MELKLVDYLDYPDHDNSEYMPYCGLCTASSEMVYLLTMSAGCQFHLCSKCKDQLLAVLNKKPTKDLRYVGSRY